ncbi:putative GTP-binding protein 6 [Aphelenchoides fujianensis]|nr:putative GTP-binding protein 6 [Aphelenchoides fujianensis]
MERQFTALRLQSGLVEWTGRAENVLVVHPKIRWGPNANPAEDVRLKLEEACALVKTLPGFSIANCMVIGTDYSVRKKTIWGLGRLDSLKEEQVKCGASSVMINVDILSPVQQAALNELLNVPVYDRTTPGRTKAKLQIALAEIPYIRTRMKHSDQTGVSSDTLHIGEATSMFSGHKENRFEILRFREHALRKKLRGAVEAKSRELEQRRALAQKDAKRAALVAVIGYTNAGKTTLIKAYEICGEDRLFATLDTTLHHALLPSKCGIFLADTIGFIADLPLNLIASFEATLRHVVNADFLIHIEDVSHPAVDEQRENVMSTLRGLNVREELLHSMIHVANKVDKLSPGELEELKRSDDRRFLVSCRSGQGMRALIESLDQVRRADEDGNEAAEIPPEARIAAHLLSLYKEGLVAEEPTQVDEDLLFCVRMTDQQMARLKARMKELGKTVRKV